MRDIACVMKDGKVIWGEGLSGSSPLNSMEKTATRN
jgi:hypothetical protein